MHSRELGDTASNGDTRGYKDTFASTKMLTIARIRAYRQREASNPPPGFDDGFESSCNRPDPTTERRVVVIDGVTDLFIMTLISVGCCP